MRMVALGEVAEINPRGDRLASDEQVSFVGMAQLGVETATASPLDSRPFSQVAKGYTVFRNGDVLAAKITPCWENGKIGQAKLDHPAGAGSTEFHVIRAGHLLDKRYLLHFLRQPSVKAAGELRMTGSAGQRRVPTAFLEGLKLRLPPLNEQRRIAVILDHADALRAKRRQVLAHLDALAHSVFHYMFALGGSHLNDAEIRPLGEVLSLRSGSFLPARAQDGGPFPVFGGNGVNGYHSDYLFEEQKIVIGRVGAYCGAVHLTPPRSWITDNALYVADVDSNLSLPYIRDSLVLANLNRFASQSGQPLISAQRIRDVPLVIPTSEAQAEYDRRMEIIDSERVVARRAVGRLDELFASLQSSAFNGQL